MNFILVLEDDSRIQKELFDTLKSINPQLQIRFFLDLGEFHEWLKKAMAEGPLSLAGAGRIFASDDQTPLTPAADHVLRLVVAKNEFLGVRNMALIRRVRDFFIRKKLCTPEEPTSSVLTAFDDPSFDIVLAEERIINNVIFKPFDKLILKQDLEFALSGRHPLDGGTISSIQMNDKVEMLKRTHFETLNELGFATLNNHEIAVGAMTKYYADVFRTDSRRSLYATCTGCLQKSPEEYLCEFHFYGAENAQVSQIRRHLAAAPGVQTQDLIPQASRAANILILDDNAATTAELRSLLTDKLKDLNIFVYSSHGQLFSDLADKDTTHRQQLPDKFDFIFANQQMLTDPKDKNWEQLVQFMKDRAKIKNIVLDPLPDLYITAKKKLNPEETYKLHGWAKEIFFFPLDRTYLVKKLFSQQKYLPPQETLTLSSLTEKSVMKIANTVDISQISEAGLVMKYYRAIALGAFREFILVRANELESPEITGTCNFAEEQKGATPRTFANHFVFFGMRDHYLKHIRLWLREAFIRQKGDEG